MPVCVLRDQQGVLPDIRVEFEEIPLVADTIELPSGTSSEFNFPDGTVLVNHTRWLRVLYRLHQPHGRQTLLYVIEVTRL